MRVISTHNGADSAFNELIGDIRAGRRPYSLHRIALEAGGRAGTLQEDRASASDREWSAESEAAWVRELEDFYGDNADEELHCVPRASAGAFLSSVLIEARMESEVPVIDGRCRRNSASARKMRGARRPRRFSRIILSRSSTRSIRRWRPASARTSDASAILPSSGHCKSWRNLKRRTPFVVELRNIPFRQQEQILFYIADRLPRLLGGAMDARGNGQYLAETARQRYGARIAQVMLSTEWYREQMPRFKAAFEDGTLAIPRDADILLDHRAIVINHGIAQVGDKRMRGSDRKPRHGDSAIAAALAYFASRQDVAEIDYRPVSTLHARRRDPWGPPPDEDSVFANQGRARFAEGAW